MKAFLKRMAVFACVLSSILVITPAAGLTAFDNVLLTLSRKIIARGDANGTAIYNKDMITLNSAFRSYLGDRVPTQDFRVLTTVLSNLEKRIDGLDDAGLAALIMSAERKNGASVQQQRFEAAFDDFVDASVFFTLASEETLDNLEKRLALTDLFNQEVNTSLAIPEQGIPILTWKRVSADQMRSADRNTNWDKYQTLYQENKRLIDGLEWGNKKQFTRLFSSNLTENQWIDQFATRLERIYGDVGAGFIDRNNPAFTELMRDMARVQYLMIGQTRSDNGSNVVPGILHLRRFNDQLGPLDLGLTAEEENGPLGQAIAAQQSATDIIDAVQQSEAEFGFRSEEILPDGILEERDFFNLIAAGYMPNDIGAGLEHGSLTHRIQWQVIFNDFRNTENVWHNTPLDLYRLIGEFDLHRDDVNRTQSFEFERPPSIWAQLFDQQSGRGDEATDLSRPDQLRELLRQAGGLDHLLSRLDRIHNDRRARGIELREMFVNGRVRLPFPISAEDTARIELLERNINANNSPDELYMLEFYHNAERSGSFQRVAGLPLLLEQSAQYSTTADPDKLAEQRERLGSKLRSEEPARPQVARVDQPPESHSQAATSSTARRTRRGAERIRTEEREELRRSSSVENALDADDSGPPLAGDNTAVEPPALHFPAVPDDNLESLGISSSNENSEDPADILRNETGDVVQDDNQRREPEPAL